MGSIIFITRNTLSIFGETIPCQSIICPVRMCPTPATIIRYAYYKTTNLERLVKSAATQSIFQRPSTGPYFTELTADFPLFYFLLYVAKNRLAEVWTGKGRSGWKRRFKRYSETIEKISNGETFWKKYTITNVNTCWWFPARRTSEFI
ncbi:hypothetical protein GWI33_023280 [Rhynchophorus ferrugineus]|uniref:Uncharacterized protein n=1 Tax=Rhynchophorus ferrugineus TaxID=354439 RepID=A0A834IRI6_RHYFE|nr:hypothetical protein GWI33_023280 [Rhynchophorus ferrugineus]